MYKTVKELPDSERPYEKCARFGPGVLSDAELLAVVIRSGTKGQNSMDLALSVLELCGPERSISGLSELTFEELKAVRGIGSVKAVQLLCLTEFSKRLWRTKNPGRRYFHRPSDCARYYMEEMRRLAHEEAVVAMLDSKCGFLGDFRLSVGTVNSSLVSAREVYRGAMKRGAVQIMLIHNHPSGDPTPSAADLTVTRNLIAAGRLLEIPMADSIIIGDGIYVSLREMDLINWETGADGEEPFVKWEEGADGEEPSINWEEGAD